MAHQNPQPTDPIGDQPASVGEETAPMLGCTAGCKLIGADVATIGAAGATGANTVVDGAADAYTTGAAGEVDVAGCANVVAGVTKAPAGNCSPGTWSTISRGIASPFCTATASRRARVSG